MGLQSPITKKSERTMPSLKNRLAGNGRNFPMNNEYKSYLQGQNTSFMQGDLNVTSKNTLSEQVTSLRGLPSHNRGQSLAPISNNTMGAIREIEVNQPHIRLSKELKGKLESLNSGGSPSGYVNNMMSQSSNQQNGTESINALRRNQQLNKRIFNQDQKISGNKGQYQTNQNGGNNQDSALQSSQFLMGANFEKSLNKQQQYLMRAGQRFMRRALIQSERTSPPMWQSPTGRSSPCKAVYPPPKFTLPIIPGVGIVSPNNPIIKQSSLNESIDFGQSPLRSTISPTMISGSHIRATSNASLIFKSPRSPNSKTLQPEELEKLQDELLMKEQLMKKRFDRYVNNVTKIEEDIRKKNHDQKAKEELDSVQKIQTYQKQVTHEEMGMIDKIVKQSGLHMEEVLRRQRRKKAFFYDQMQNKFGVFWNKKVDTLSIAKRPKEGTTKKKKLQLFALKTSGSDINEILKDCINEIWGDYDTDGSGVLEKPETKIFVSDILESLGLNNGQFSDHDFEQCFQATDSDGNGVISKSEMRFFVKNVAGL